MSGTVIQPVLFDNMTQRHAAMASAAALLSTDTGNALSAGTDGGLYMANAAQQRIVSQQEGNMLRYGSDLGAFVDGNDILSNAAVNVIVINPIDKKIILTKDTIVDVVKEAGIGGDPTVKQDVEKLKTDVTELQKEVKDVVVVSGDRGNVLFNGRDNGAYLSADDIIDVVEDAGITGKVDVNQLINLGTDPLLGKQGDKLVSGLSLQYSQATGRLDILGVNGQSVANATIPTAVALLERVQLEDNPSGQPAGTYIHFQFRLTDQSIADVYLNVNKLAQFYSAGDGISISPDGVISVNRTALEAMVGTAIDNELGRGGKITTAINNAIADELGPRGSITEAIKDGVEDALDTSAVKDKIAEITEDAIKNGDISLVSTDAGNLLEKGTDSGAKLSKDKVVEAVGESVKEIATEAIKQAIKDGEVNIISQDADNQLTAGADGGAYLAKSEITDTVNEAIGDGTIPLVSTDEDNLLTVGSDGAAFLDKKDVPAAGPSTDPGNAITEGSDGKLYFKPVTDYGLLD